MTAPGRRGSWIRSGAYAVLAAAVRGRRARGGPWGEAVLAEFAETTGRWQAVRWAAGGLRTAWRERRARAPQRRVLRLAVVALVALVPVPQFVLDLRTMQSTAMAPTLDVGSRFLVDRVSHRFTGLRPGDVVEMPIPDHPDRVTEKRVVGLPGDTIDCPDGVLRRNGLVVDDRATTCTPATVPAGTVWVLGDNREVSQDSRHWGPIPQDHIRGRVVVRIWPPS